MAGRRHGDFRSGDLNEELGILLLKSFATVACVPRPEDTGIDAVATLLRDGAKDLLIAESSFFVQLKSHSTRTVKFTEHEVDWVKNLKLPFFIGSVCKEQAAIELYSTHRLSEFLVNEPPPLIRLHLDQESEQQMSADAWDVCIWPPVLNWTTAVFGDDAFSSQAYSVIEPHVVAEQRNIEARNVNYCEKIIWETGKPPAFGGPAFALSGSPAEITAISKAMAPALSALALYVWRTRNEVARQAILRLFDVIQKIGIEPAIGITALLEMTWNVPDKVQESKNTQCWIARNEA